MANKQPYIPLYIGDWEQDTNLLSLEAEAGWLKIIFKMFKGDKSGIYKVSTKALQKLWKKGESGIMDIITELSDANICGISLSDGFVEFTNRRMNRAHSLSKIRSEAVQNRYKTEHPSENEYESNSSPVTKKSKSNIPKSEDIKQSKEKKPRKKKINPQAEPYWKELVKLYFSFCHDTFKAKPSFDGSAPHDMHRIIEVLKSRAAEAKIEWTERVALDRWRGFLGHAYADTWLSNNWLLSNINHQKDKIFMNISKVINGTTHKSTSQPGTKKGTSDARIETASKW